jgi:hypothetical protein
MAPTGSDTIPEAKPMSNSCLVKGSSLVGPSPGNSRLPSWPWALLGSSEIPELSILS